MSIVVERADFSDPALPRFLQAHLDDLEPTAPEESRHALDLTGLQAPGARMWVAADRSSGQLVGTGALASLCQDHEELKSMRTEPAYRGRGVASAILAAVLGDARSRGIRRISLETGSMDFFQAARALYAKSGFVECSAFGSYAEDPNSCFMTMELGCPPRHSTGMA